MKQSRKEARCDDNNVLLNQVLRSLLHCLYSHSHYMYVATTTTHPLYHHRCLPPKHPQCPATLSAHSVPVGVSKSAGFPLIKVAHIQPSIIMDLPPQYLHNSCCFLLLFFSSSSMFHWAKYLFIFLCISSL